MATEEVRSVVVVHDELVSLGPREERADAVVNIRRRKAAAILCQMSDCLVEPSFLFLGRTSGLPVAPALLANEHRVHVFMSHHRAKVRSALKRGAQVHHVALITERRPKRQVQIGNSDEPVDGVAASSQVIEPARKEDREPAIAVDVRRRPEPARHQREDPVVEGVDDVRDQLGPDRSQVLAGHIHLTVLPDSPQLSRNGGVIAGAVDVAVAHQHVKHPFLRRSRLCAVQILVRSRTLRTRCRNRQRPVDGKRGYPCAGRRFGLELDRKRPFLTRKR